MTDRQFPYVDGSDEQIEAMITREKDEISKNRARTQNAQWTGIALSGGGIRSAIFCLGALQALAAKNVLGNFDYMSTVSGGGYIGSALQWIWRKDPATGTSPANFPFGTEKSLTSGVVETDQRLTYLRTHGQYLTPGEGISIWSLTAVVVRTLFLNLFIWIPIGALLIIALIAAFQLLQPTFFGSVTPNFFSVLMAAKWKNDCPKGEQCNWPLELFFGDCVFAGLLFVLIFAFWAVAFSLDTRISPPQEISPRPFRRFVYAAFALVAGGVSFLVIRYLFDHVSNPDPFTAAGAVLIAALPVILTMVFILQGRADASANYKSRRRFEEYAGAALPWVTIIFAIGSIPIIPYLLINHAGPFLKGIAAATAAVSGIVAAISGHNAQSQKEAPTDTTRWLLMLVSGVFLYSVALTAYFVAQLWIDPAPVIGPNSFSQNMMRGIIVFSMVLAFALGWMTNINYVGLHRFYRDRLMEAFMPDPECVRQNVVGRSQEADTLSIRDLWPPVTGTDKSKRAVPYPIVNTNSILINDADRQVAWRGGDNFILSPLYVGCRSTGWENTASHIQKHGPLSLASAMAASGAAMNANAAYVGAGVTRDRLLSIVLMLLNLGLAIWIGKPSASLRRSHPNVPNHFNPGFVYGMTRGGYNRQSAFMELSDGGHFENLGLYELIRRRLSVILVLDGEEDAATAMPALYSVAQRVNEDFGAILNLDGRLDDLVPKRKPGYPDGAKFVKNPYFAAPITYRGGETGVLIYVKLSLAEKLGFGARGYRAQNRDFPQQSTANQFFVPEQIEAYREVGYVNMSIALETLDLKPGAFDLDEILRRFSERNQTAAPANGAS